MTGNSAMNKWMLTVAVFATAIASEAVAADLAVPAPMYTKAPAPVVAPIHNWTGLYIGGNVGWLGANVSSGTNAVATSSETLAGGVPDLDVTNAMVAGATTSSQTQHPSGFLGG